jgi:hypothetical protein
MAVNNQAIVNAVVAGGMGALVQGRFITSGTATDYAQQAAAAGALAAQVDSKIPTDGAMNAAKANLCQEIVKGVMGGRDFKSAVAADYDVEAIAIAAAYNEGKLQLG